MHIGFTCSVSLAQKGVSIVSISMPLWRSHNQVISALNYKWKFFRIFFSYLFDWIWSNINFLNVNQVFVMWVWSILSTLNLATEEIWRIAKVFLIVYKIMVTRYNKFCSNRKDHFLLLSTHFFAGFVVSANVGSKNPNIETKRII